MGSGEGSRLSEVLPVAGHRQRNPSIVHKRTDTQGGPAADFLRGTLLSVPPQPDGTDSAGYHIAGKPKRNESRPFLAGRLHDAAQTRALRTACLHRIAGICPRFRHPGQKPAEDIRHPLRGKDFEKPAPFQLGSRNLDRTAETVCRHRCLGMPQHLQQAARTETDRRF